MKKLVILLVLAFSLVMQTWAITSVSEISKQIDTVASSVGSALPMASATGLNWSDAYIGSIIGVPPHFGVGVTAGTAMIPLASITDMATTMGVSIPSWISGMPIGLPLPTYTVEARVGGLILPFDAGIKVGVIPGDTKAFTGSFALDYLLVGGDIRYAILEENLVFPDLSLGLGFNYLKGGVAFTASDITLGSVDIGTGTQNVVLANPKLALLYESSNVDVKLQVSKNLIVVTPYAGLAGNIAFNKVGAGMFATPKVGSTALTPSELAALAANFPGLSGGDAVSATSEGIVALFQQNGQISARVYGGVSVNIIVAYIDLNAMYNFMSNSMGASLGFRIQL